MSSNTERRDAAVDWLQRLPDKNMSEEQLQAWLYWYGSNEANQQAFEKAQEFYVRLRGMNPSQRATLRGVMPVPNRRPVLWAVAASLAMLSLAFILWGFFEPQHQTLAYAAPSDRYRTVRLADGSAMVLNARAVANVSYTPQARVLDLLQGAAYFEVKPDGKRPFVVRAGEISVTAVGTAFSITREADRFSITVTEGSVDVIRAAERARRVHVKAGGRTTLAVGPASPPKLQPPANATNEWHDGSVQFFNTPLGDVVKAVNVHARHPILIDDPRVTDLNYSGTVFRERIEEWTASLPQVYPVRNVLLEDGSMTLVLRPGPN
jgi:transmembrane sensor